MHENKPLPAKPDINPDARGKRDARTRAHDQYIFSAALRIGVLVLIAKLCVAAREIAVASYYGTSPVVDAYNIAFTVVTWVPILLLAAGAVAVVPTFVGLRRARERQIRFVAEFNTMISVAAVALVVATAVLGPHAAKLIAGSARTDIVSLAGVISYQMAPFSAFVLLSGAIAFRLQAEERFAYSALEAIPALGVGIAVVLMTGLSGAKALIIGTLAGGAVQLLLMLLMSRSLDCGWGGFRRSARSPEWRLVLGGFAIIGVGQVLIYGSVPLDQYYAAKSGGGYVAILGYVNRLLGIATSMGTVVLGRAMLPTISGVVSSGDSHFARSQLLRWSAFAWLGAAVVAAVGWILTPEAIRLFLQRGAFGPDDTAAVARLVRIGLLQLPFYLGGLVLVQGLAAHNRYRDISVISAVALIVKVGTLITLFPHLGPDAILFSTVSMYATSFFVQLARTYASDPGKVIAVNPIDKAEI